MRGTDRGLFTGAVFIDLRKVFDSVDHKILIGKLESYGLKHTELDWFRNYLTDRKQLVRFGKEISYRCPITSGVPQGSILGPLLIVLIVNDLSIVLGRCQILMYVDDTALVIPRKSVVLLPLNFPRCPFVNQGKTECILFGTDCRLMLIIL